MTGVFDMNMKKLLAAVLVLVIGVMALTACSGSVAKDERIDKAVAALKDYWTGYYTEMSESENDRANGDWYLEIKNTRLVELGEVEKEPLKDVKYVVEFMIYTNFYGVAPYYSNIDVRNTVFIYKDGTVEAGSVSGIPQYIAMYYEAPPIANVHDYGTQYNAVYHLEEQ